MDASNRTTASPAHGAGAIVTAAGALPDCDTDRPQSAPWLANMSLRAKLALNALLPMVLVAALTAWITFEFNRLEQQELPRQRVLAERTRTVHSLELDVVQVQQFLQDVSATRALDGLDDGFRLADEAAQHFRRDLAALGDVQDSAALLAAFDDYYARGVDMAKAYVADGPAGGNPHMAVFDQASDRLQHRLHEAIAREDAAAEEGRQTLADRAHAARWLTLLNCVAVLALMFGGSWVIARSIRRPLEVATRVAHRIADGDLRHRFMPVGSDEVGQMLAAMGTMQDRLKLLISQVQSNAQRLDLASNEIAGANRSLGEQTERNAAALQQTTASMGQIEQGMSASAALSSGVLSRTQEASSAADASSGRVGELVEAIASVKRTAQRIADITGTIDGIAFQTNILSLNAAVEAARAGESGRGFAVVAGEVRALAQRAAGAAREIRDLSGETSRSIAEGESVAAQVSASMRDTVERSRDAARGTGEIEQLTQAQRQELQQVVAAIRVLDGSTQQNAAMVEQTAAAAEAMHRQASELAEAVSVFRL